MKSKNSDDGYVPTKRDNIPVAIGYLYDIMARITADGVIDRDELLELHLAIERIIPTAHRTPVISSPQETGRGATPKPSRKTTY